jgi:outer membrane protein assembly factor BamB
VVAGGTVYVPGQNAVTALRLSDGGHVWTRAGLQSADGVAVDADRVYVNDVSAAVALRRTDGQVIWRYEPPMYTGFSAGEPAVRGGRVYLPGVPQGAVLDAVTGALLLRPWIHAAPALDTARAYVLDGEPGESGEVLHARAGGNGATRWEFGAETGITTSPLVSGETVYAMGTRGVLYALDRTTGRLTWCDNTGTINYSGSQVSLAAGPGILVLAIGGEVVALGPGGKAGCDYYGESIPGYHGTGGDTDSAGAGGAQASMARAAGLAPAGFERNVGQFPPSVRYAARGRGHTLLVRRDGATLALGARDGLPGGDVRVDLRLRGAQAARAVRGGPALAGVVNDYRGSDPARWHTGVALHRSVRLHELRPGIDMVLRRGGAERFEYDLVVAPGADVRDLALDFRGGARPQLDDRGRLVIGTRAGILRQPPPVAYQRRAGRRERVPARFRLLAGGGVGFALGAFDSHRPLVIDPELEWGSFLGGGVDDAAADVTTDADGFVYVAGRTGSRNLGTLGALDGWDERNAICEDRPCGDAFVAKLRPGGTGLVYVTYLSGRREDRAEAIATDAGGNAYVTGYTMSPNFPVLNAMQPDWRCGSLYGDAFVVKLAPDGSRMRYGTYLGGCNTFLGEAGRGIDVDAQGRAVVAGHTDSFEFPTTAGAADRTCAPSDGFCNDAFVAKLSTDGSKLVWSTLFGGDGSEEYAYDVSIDAKGRPVIAGTAYGFATTDFPATPGAYDTQISSRFSEVFAARLAADGSRINWATAFGGRDWDDGLAMELDAQGDVHIAGRTESSDFPTTAGAHDRVCNAFYEEFSCTNHADGFALELSADGARLLTSTYIGGAGEDSARAIALDANGRDYLTGATASSAETFPLVAPFQPEQRGLGEFCASRSDCSDAYVMRLSPNKAKVEYSSFLGGRSHDVGEGIALAGGDAWVAGFTHSTDLATTPDGTQPSAPGGDCGFFRGSLEFAPCSDGFLSRIGPQPPPAALLGG